MQHLSEHAYMRAAGCLASLPAQRVHHRLSLHHAEQGPQLRRRTGASLLWIRHPAAARSRPWASLRDGHVMLGQQ